MKLKLLTVVVLLTTIIPLKGISSPTPAITIGVKVSLGRGSDCIRRGVCSITLFGSNSIKSTSNNEILGKRTAIGKIESIENKFILTLSENSLSDELKKEQFGDGKFVMEEQLVLSSEIVQSIRRKEPPRYIIPKGTYLLSRKADTKEIVIQLEIQQVNSIDTKPVSLTFGTVAKLYSTVVYLEVKDTYKPGMSEEEFSTKLLKQTGDGPANKFLRDFYKKLYPCCVMNCDPDNFYRNANGDAFSILLKNLKPIVQNWSKDKPANTLDKEALLQYLAPNYKESGGVQGKFFNRIRKTIDVILECWDKIEVIWE
jgi:hypothetical protein